MKNKSKILIWLMLVTIIIGSIIYIKYDLNDVDSNKNITNTAKEDTNDWIPVGEVEISDVPDNITGYLSIPCLNNNYYMNMPIKEGTDLNILATSIGHFENTPFLNGNICLVAHNSGTNKRGKYVGYFDKIKDLKKGDEIIFNNLLQTNTYKVITNKIISEKDMSVLNNADEDKITLITCVKGSKNKEYRQCVVAKKLT